MKSCQTKNLNENFLLNDSLHIILKQTKKIPEDCLENKQNKN